MRRKIRLWVMGLSAVLVAAVLGVVGVPALLWLNAWFHDRPFVEGATPGFTNDASHLNRTGVAEVWKIPAEPAEAESQLRDLLARARSGHLKIAIAGARHSMGGHTIYPDGIVLDMLPFDNLELIDDTILRAGAGARWSEVIPYLDAHGRSVAIMQSNNDFSVGGSVSVNCHGWQQNQPPIAAKVESMRVMQADGTIVHCSRTENRELFSLVLGGYGLFGVILDVDLRVVPNERYRAEPETLPCAQYATRFAEKVDDSADIGMAYGRLCVVPGDDTFLRDAILTVFRRYPCPAKEIPPLSEPAYTKVRREVYRAQIGSRAGKKARWQAEKALGEQLAGDYVSRNQLLNEPAIVYQEGNPDRTDILHEYFIPSEQMTQFLERVRGIVPRYDFDLMNVTVRDVKADHDAFLRYADCDMFGFVMLFNQLRTPAAGSQMEKMTQEIIDAALECNGRYYLPYRLHATPEQFARAYPQAKEWLALKRKYDPDEIFQNEFYTKYGRQ